MMECAEMFTTVARCFSPTTEAEWAATTSKRTWGAFLTAIRFALQDISALADPQPFVARIHATCPLQDFLAAPEINALFDPLSFEEKEAFAMEHFNSATQDSRESALPIESLYLSWNNAVCSPLSRGSDQPGSPAVHVLMSPAYRGFVLPAGLQDASEDHLAVELLLVAKLFEDGERNEAFVLIRDHFGWLSAYRRRLMTLHDTNVEFYVALVDALMGIWVQIEPMEVAS